MEQIETINIPCGAAIPAGNPHAVSVSLPTIADVIGYEEDDPLVLNKMVSGYPRFFMNPFVRKLVGFVRRKYGISGQFELLPVASIHAKNILEKLVSSTLKFVEESGNVFIILEGNNPINKCCKDYIRHCGLLISSRQAEETLYNLDEIASVFSEPKSDAVTAIPTIKSILADAYQTNPEQIFLCNSGANAVFAIHETVLKIRASENRNTVVRLGCLYVDTMEIIEKRSINSYVQINISDKEMLENWLQLHHQSVSILLTEVPNNPLVQCLDLPWLSELCKQYDIVLIIDSTIATPFNIDVLRWCDVAVESLTKFASGNADVLLGAVVMNPKSKFSEQIVTQINDYLIPAFEGDLCRLAVGIVDYENRVSKVASNTKLLLDYLETLSIVMEIHSVNHSKSIQDYSKIRRNETAIPGVISIVFDQPLAYYYDKFSIAKGPSLGTEFTLAMPYVYLAHYDLLQSESGKRELQNMGLHPELLRISVGTEPIAELIAAFEALKTT